jgi:hypothetical protein
MLVDKTSRVPGEYVRYSFLVLARKSNEEVLKEAEEKMRIITLVKVKYICRTCMEKRGVGIILLTQRSPLRLIYQTVL